MNQSITNAIEDLEGDLLDIQIKLRAIRKKLDGITFYQSQNQRQPGEVIGNEILANMLNNKNRY